MGPYRDRMSREKPTAQTLARRMVQAASAQVDATEAAAIRDDPDGVHRHRTAVRRLRTVVTAVGRLSDAAEIDALRGALKPWGRLLGEARDAEVRAERAADVLAELGIDDADARRRLVGDERADGRHLHARIVEAHASETAQRRIQLVREAGLRLELDAPDAKGGKTFRTLLRREGEKLRRAARRQDGSLERLHEVRKVARRLRYLAEAIEDAAPESRDRGVHEIARAAKRVHKLLGNHRDDLLLAERARELHRRAFVAQERTAPYDAVVVHVTARAETTFAGLPRALKRVKKAAARVG